VKQQPGCVRVPGSWVASFAGCAFTLQVFNMGS
jgi:hypothetical protein